jgi:3',5'-cyclic AMP phosphodiesterase CpdA
MPSGLRLATFVHISDLHFGEVDRSTFQVTYPAWMIALWTHAPFFTGLVGHEYAALLDLQQFFTDLRTQEQARLIVTGDLTSCGSVTQLAAAEAYLGEVLKPPLGNFVGLQESDWRKQAIPGNHDHWPGNFFSLGPPGPRFQSWFQHFPYVGPALPLTAGRAQLRFLGAGIDTDANVYPGTPDRLLARGSFTTQLLRLSLMLPHRGRDEIRVLLLHHSLAHRGLTLEINPGSRKQLEQFLAVNDIRVILTGHTHEPLVQPFQVTTSGPAGLLRWFAQPTRQVQCLEGRCGTTAQATKVPLGWPSSGHSRDLCVNTLLVHRLYEQDDGRIVWHAETYRRSPMRGFEKVPPGLPGPSLDAEMVVWA